MSETLITIPGRDYQIKVAMQIDVAGNRANFLEDAEKIRTSIAAAIDEVIKKAASN
jgi:hypothetical protein